MGRIFIFGVAIGAASYAYQEYTGRSVISSIQSISIGGGGGAFAGGYGIAVDANRSTGASMGSFASGISNRMGSVGN